MSAEANKALVRRFLAETNEALTGAAKIRAIYEKYTTPDFVHHDPSRGDANREQRIMATVLAFSAFPDARYEAEDQVAEGDKVANRYTLRATHTRPFMGISPTGKQITVRGANIYRIVDGRIAETWDYVDMMGMMIQMGAELRLPGQR